MLDFLNESEEYVNDAMTFLIDSATFVRNPAFDSDTSCFDFAFHCLDLCVLGILFVISQLKGFPIENQFPDNQSKDKYAFRKFTR